MKNVIFIVLLYTAGAVIAQPQTNTITGFINDVGGHVMPGATVFISTLQKGAVTDIEGKFTLEGIPAGKYDLQVRYIGHEPIVISCIVPLDKPLNIKLTGEYHLLNEVVVAEKKNITGLVTNSSLSAEQMQQSKGASLAEAVANITGVTILQTGPAIAKPVIHGLHSNRVLILNNGVRQEGQQWGTEHAPEIDPFTANDITVVKGAAAVRYGSDAIAGALLVEPAELPTQNSLSGEVNMIGSTNGRQGIASLTLANGSDKLPGLGWRLQSSAKKAGDFHAPNYMLTNTGLEELNFSGEIGFKNEKWGSNIFYSLFTTQIGILKSAHVGNTTDLIDAIQRGEPFFIEDFSYDINNPRQDVAHHLLKSESFYRFSEDTKLTLSLSRQINNREEFDVRRGENNNRPALDLSLGTNQAEAVVEHLHNDELKGTFGLAFIDQKNRNIPGTGVRPLIPNYLSTSFGVFAIENFAKGKWELEAGMRYDYRTLDVFKFNKDDELINPNFNFHNFSLTGGAAYQLNENIKIKTQLASAFRPPSVSELFSEGLHHGLAAIEEGNPDLDTEKAFKWVNTLEYNQQPFQFTASFYYQKIQDFIYLRPQSETRLTVRGAFPVFTYEQTNARLMGLDAAFNWNLTDWLQYTARYSMVRAKDLTEDTYLINMPSDQFENEFMIKKENVGNFSKLYARANTIYTAKQNRVPGIDYTPPPEAYWLVNLNAGVDFLLGDHEAGIGLTLNNAFNTSYRSYLNRLRYYADDMGRNLIVRLYVNI